MLLGIAIPAFGFMVKDFEGNSISVEGPLLLRLLSTKLSVVVLFIMKV